MSGFGTGLPYGETALVLQGGGALGSYQAGAYSAFSEAGLIPHWLAGISIGAINTAIIAGNAPNKRVVKLKSFWNRITGTLPQMLVSQAHDITEQAQAIMGTAVSLAVGASGFFAPRMLPPWLQLPGSAEATSFYDTSALIDTLNEHVDWNRLNDGETRVSLGAVNVESGNFAFFDNRETRIGAEHVMASGALPPGLPWVEIDGQRYWDGGLVSNTPLSYVLNECSSDTLVFQIDLFSGKGSIPQTLIDVEERRKDIVYSSRTRMNTDAFRARHALKAGIAKLVAELPEDRRDDPDIKEICELATAHRVSIVHLIYRRTGWGGASKDFEFSRGSMLKHWAAGQHDAQVTLKNDKWRTPPSDKDAITVYDLAAPGLEDERAGIERLEGIDLKKE